MRKTLEELSAGKLICGDPDLDSAWKQKAAPPWFDQEKFDRGIGFFREHTSSVLFSYLLSLIIGFNLDVFLQTLLFTGQSSTPEISSKRYFATLLYILQWYDTDVTDSNSKGYKSLMKVRRIHHHVRSALKKRQKQILLDFVDHGRGENDGGFLVDGDEETSSPPSSRHDSVEDDFIYIDLQRPSAADIRVADPRSSDYAILSRPVQIEEGDDKLYLNQYDMALVQVAFIGGIVIDAARLGINATTKELDEYIFTWRVFGWFLGIQDRFNVCDGSYEEVLSITCEVRDLELGPAVKKKSPEANALVHAFLAGFGNKIRRTGGVSPAMFLSPSALLTISVRYCGLEKGCEPSDLTYFDEFSILVLTGVFKITYYIPWFRKVINSLLSLPNVMKLLM